MATAIYWRVGGRRSAGECRLSLDEWLVLCLVGEEPAYGLAVAGLLDRDGSLGQIWSVPKSRVYAAVQRLEILGLITRTGQQRSSLGPVRSLLAATPAGRAAAQAWLQAPAEQARDVRSELMVKLALLDRAGSDPRALALAQLARLLPAAAALDDQLRAATGFEYTVLLWRHKSLAATMRFLEGITAGQGPPSPDLTLSAAYRPASATRVVDGPWAKWWHLVLQQRPVFPVRWCSARFACPKCLRGRRRGGQVPP